MKIALLGYGKMGKLIEQIALPQEHEVLLKVSRHEVPLAEQIDILKKVDVGIDFSHASCILNHLHTFANYQKPLIIGTTGWDEHLHEAKRIVEKSGIGCLYAPNFSIGVGLFMQMIAYAAQLMASFEEYDVAGVEQHHRQKLDSPSGTAKALTQQIIEHMKRAKQFEFSSVRCGHIPGTHTIQFDSPVDTITLSHQARNREGFAHGALKAAQWILGKKGFFTLNDLLLNKG